MLIKPRIDGRRFSYPDEQRGSRWDALRWAVTRKPAKWPRNLGNPPAAQVMHQVGEPDLRITFINHATTLIQSDSLNIITDPVFSKRVSPVSFAGPKRFRPAGITLADLPTIHAILISHTHYDHLDLASIRALCERDNPQIIAPLNNGSVISKVTDQPTTELSWWDSTPLGGKATVTLTPARHWTSRSLGDENTCLWGAFVIGFSSGAVYFGGDTGYGDGEHFRQAAEQHGPFRCALLPIGAYEPRWFMKPMHMNPTEAVAAFKDLQAQYAIGIHHGTFQLTDEAHDAPVIALNEALAEHSIDAQTFITLPNGCAWDVPALI